MGVEREPVGENEWSRPTNARLGNLNFSTVKIASAVATLHSGRGYLPGVVSLRNLETGSSPIIAGGCGLRVGSVGRQLSLAIGRRVLLNE